MLNYLGQVSEGNITDLGTAVHDYCFVFESCAELCKIRMNMNN